VQIDICGNASRTSSLVTAVLANPLTDAACRMATGSSFRAELSPVFLKHVAVVITQLAGKGPTADERGRGLDDTKDLIDGARWCVGSEAGAIRRTMWCSVTDSPDLWPRCRSTGLRRR